MKDDIFPYERKCAKCGKIIYPNPSWVYKKGGRYYCSWKCFNKVTGIPKQDIVYPKVGDTIEIIRVPGIPQYSHAIGVVEFYDTMGQMHGTWGAWVIVPGLDRYKIISEANDDSRNNGIE